MKEINADNYIFKTEYKDEIEPKHEGDTEDVRIVNNKRLHEVIEFLRQRCGKEVKILVVNSVTTFPGGAIDLNYSNCTFLSDVKVTSNVVKPQFGISFNDCTFKESVNFTNTKFRCNVRFQRSKFMKELVLVDTEFSNLADFYCAEFFSPQQFAQTDFYGHTIFSKTKFHKPAQFIYNKVKSNAVISFESAEFKQSLDISRANFWCKLQFWGVSIGEINPIGNPLFEDDKISGKVSGKTENSVKRLRETYRIIKNTFLSERNQIEAFKFKKYEFSLYWYQVRKFNKGRCHDWIILFFNRISNNFGASFGLGILFTFISCLIFYSIFLLCISDRLVYDPTCDGFLRWLTGGIQFLNVANWKYQPFGIKEYNDGFFYLFIGRVFIGYGIYQTISAFRKFGVK